MSTTITIRADEPLREALDKKAAASGKTVSELVSSKDVGALEKAPSSAQLAFVKTWLIDTGPLVAYLDARDPGHGEVVACLEDFSGQLTTTSAVITEAMHFVSASKEGPRVLAEFVAMSRTEVYDS